MRLLAAEPRAPTRAQPQGHSWMAMDIEKPTTGPTPKFTTGKAPTEPGKPHTFRATIIIPCHNVEAFIEDSFATIVRQSVFADLEVIPVNDGSRDRTGEIIAEWTRLYPDNFFPISFETGSGGPGRPRNAALERARGEYILFMDPDDRIYKDGYSLLLNTIEKCGSDIVIGTRYAVPEKKGADERVWVDWIADREVFNTNAYSFKLDLLSQRPVILKAIYRRDLIEKWNLRFIETISTSEDEIFDKKYLLLSEKITKINDVVYLYTVARPGSITSKVTLKLYQDLPAVFTGMHDALSVYFPQEIVSYRIASLIRTFYLPKLELLDTDQVDDALELLYQACADYGFDRLLLTANTTENRLVQLLSERKFAAMLLAHDAYRIAMLRRQVSRLNSKVRKVRGRRSVRGALKATHWLGNLSKAARAGELRQLYHANVTEGRFPQTTNGYWLFMDRRDKGSDNGEALYRYVRDNTVHDKIAFVVSEQCRDSARLRADGFNVVAYNSIEHWRLLYGCEYFFTSHVDDVVITPWLMYGRAIRSPRYKLVFLQHGIIRSDLSSWLGRKSYYRFCTTTTSEFEGILHNPAYRLGPNQLRLTGLARHDLLRGDEPGRYLLVHPTWRSFLLDRDDETFKASQFFREWSLVLENPRILAALERSGIGLRFVLHSSLKQYTRLFPRKGLVEVLSYDDIDSFADLVSGAAAVLTDYSTISFDVLYLRRPAIYFTFVEGSSHSTNAGADLDLYSRLGHRVTTAEAVADTVERLADAGWVVGPDKLEAIDQFFRFSDRENRRRVIEATLEVDLDG